MDISVITVVENDSGLFDLMVKSVRRFSPNIKFIVCNNGKPDPILTKYYSDPNIIVIYNEPELSGGSNRHGDGLNKALQHVETQYAAIIESDCAVVSEKWCDVDFKTYSLMASKKGDAGFPFYYAAFMVFDCNVMREVDMRPGPDRRSGKNYQPHEDVAHDIHKRISVSNIKPMECVDCKTGRGQILGSDMQSEEYWVDGVAAVVHFGRGSNLKGKANRKGFDDHNSQMKRFREEVEKLIGE